MTDQIIYIVLLTSGDILAFKNKADAEAECYEKEDTIVEAYLQ